MKELASKYDHLNVEKIFIKPGVMRGILKRAIKAKILSAS